MMKYGLLGRNLAHSISKTFFEAKFKREGLTNFSYLNIQLEEINDFKTLLLKESFNGLNVTIHYKEAVIPFLDSLTKEAEKIGAVNTIEFKAGKLIGHNTDHLGFHNSIKPFLENTMERALILGTGGASKAVVYALESIGIDCLTVSRNPKDMQLSYSDLNEYVFKHHLLIVNCTPVGTSPNIADCPQIPYKFINENHLVVDLIYNPNETLFLTKAKQEQARILNGKAMLMHQAEEAWKIWNS